MIADRKLVWFRPNLAAFDPAPGTKLGSFAVQLIFSSCLLNYLGLVDGGGMWTDHGGARPGFGPECSVSPSIVLCAVSLRHLGAVGLTVLVIRVLLTGKTPQTFIYFILIICHRWVAAGQRRLLVILGDTSWPRTRICGDDGSAV